MAAPPPTNKRKRAPRVVASGIYKSDSVMDVAESLGIPNLPETVASALASDVEYRLNQVIETASRFTRHARRSTMTTADIDNALRALNIPPLYGHSLRRPGSPPPTFRRLHPAIGPPVYVLDDEEVDFEKVVKEEEIQVPRSVRWSAHWLAIEGVQPLISENPPPSETSSSSNPMAHHGQSTLPTPPPTQSLPSNGQSQLSNGAVPKASSSSTPALVKATLPGQLQLYYTRLTSALLPPSRNPSDSSYERNKLAALGSLRSDAGLQQVLPYLVRWAGENVVKALRSGTASDPQGGMMNGMEGEDDDIGEGDIDRRGLEVLLEAINALLDNPRLFVEPYLHQLLPPILSILLVSTLTTSPHPLSLSSAPTPTHLRTHASSLLSHLLRKHLSTYASLAPRLTKTLLAALVEPGRSVGTREGAVRGLSGVGTEAVKRGLIDAGGAKIIGEELMSADREMERYGGGGDGGPVALENAVMAAFELLHPLRSQHLPTPLNEHSEEGSHIAQTLRSTIGPYFTDKLINDHVDSGRLVGLLERISTGPVVAQAPPRVREVTSDFDMVVDGGEGGGGGYGGSDEVMAPV